MIAAFVRKNLQATIERLNRREIFSCEFYQARNMDAAKKSVEDGGSFSHIIFDVAVKIRFFNYNMAEASAILYLTSLILTATSMLVWNCFHAFQLRQQL